MRAPPSEMKASRPLSPHIQVYKPQLTSVLSILHRITGVALCLGTVVFVAWLVALAGGPESYASFLGWAQSGLGQIVLFGLSAAFFFHLCCGARHLLWDAGLFLEIKDAYKTGHIALAAAILLTLAVWLKAYGVSL